MVGNVPIYTLTQTPTALGSECRGQILHRSLFYSLISIVTSRDSSGRAKSHTSAMVGLDIERLAYETLIVAEEG